MPSPAMRWSKCRDSCAVHTRLRAWQRHSDVPTRGMGLSNATGSLSCTRSPPHHCQSTALTRETPRNASAPHCRLSLACVRPLDGVGLRHFCLAHRADAGPRPFADAPHTVPGYAPPSRHLISLRRAIKRWRFQPRCSAARTALHSTDLLSGAALDPGGEVVWPHPFGQTEELRSIRLCPSKPFTCLPRRPFSRIGLLHVGQTG